MVSSTWTVPVMAGTLGTALFFCSSLLSCSWLSFCCWLACWATGPTGWLVTLSALPMKDIRTVSVLPRSSADRV